MTVGIIVGSADRPSSGSELECGGPIVNGDLQICRPILPTLVSDGSISSA